MITRIVWSIANGLFFHFNTSNITEEIRMIIIIIGMASDLNLFATFSRK